MTATEAYAYIDQKLDKTGTGLYEIAEKQIFIKDATEEFLIEKRKLLGADLINDSMILSLIQKETITQTSTSAGLYQGVFDPTWKWILQGFANLTQPLGVVSLSELYSKSLDPFDASLFVGSTLNWLTKYGETLLLIVLKEPTFNFSTSEFVNLPIMGQREVLNRCVRQMMLAVEDPRYQAANNEETE
jgi:hypothetical protein